MEWEHVVLDPLRMFVHWLVIFIPRLVTAMIVLLIGWTVASVVQRLVVRLLQALKIDRLSEKARLSDVLRRGAVRSSFVELLGRLVYWLLIIATITVALQFVGLTAASQWLERLGYFVPRLIVSIVILLFGLLLASFLGATVRATSLNAGFPQGYLLGQVVSTAIVVLTIIVALEQLEVVTRTIEVALYILLASFGLAFAIAVGLGAQGLAKRFLEDILWERWKTSHRP